MRKRILYIGNDLLDPSFTPTYISFLGKALRREGYIVKTASRRNSKARRIGEMCYLVWKNRRHAGMVLIDTYGARNFFYAVGVARLCRYLGMDYIPILHGGELPARLKASEGWSRELFGKALYNIAPSAYLHGIFRREGFDNLKLISNSVDLSKFFFRDRRKFRPRLLWVRRFQERYNPMMALEVLELLQKVYPDARLCMVGPEKDGFLQKCRARAAQLGLEVRFPGKHRKSEWRELAGEYDYFINTTRIDNTPLSMIEAMALGLPVISTNVGGISHLIEDGWDGLLVPSGDAEAMAGGIMKLLADQEKSRSLALRAYEKVQEFDWRKVRLQWREVLG